jgi:hypothetical protein
MSNLYVMRKNVSTLYDLATQAWETPTLSTAARMGRPAQPD